MASIEPLANPHRNLCNINRKECEILTPRQMRVKSRQGHPPHQQDRGEELKHRQKRKSASEETYKPDSVPHKPEFMPG